MRNYSVPLPAQQINKGEASAGKHDKTMFTKENRRSRSVYLYGLGIHIQRGYVYKGLGGMNTLRY